MAALINRDWPCSAKAHSLAFSRRFLGDICIGTCSHVYACRQLHVPRERRRRARSENRLVWWRLPSDLPPEGTSLVGSAVHECLNMWNKCNVSPKLMLRSFITPPAFSDPCRSSRVLNIGGTARSRRSTRFLWTKNNKMRKIGAH